MDRNEQLLLTDLTELVSTLGQDGGQISASVYDTAQTLRFAASSDSDATLEWLSDQQHSDGGWGDPAIPRSRAASTLAAVLALHARGHGQHADQAVRAGLAYLGDQAHLWDTLPDDMPIAAEVVLPRLVDEALDAGLTLDPLAYTKLRTLGNRRKRMIMSMPPSPGAPAFHSWEAWGTCADPRLLDAAGSVGHSPAATAAWYAAAGNNHDVHREHALAYLEAAAQATSVRLPGVVPTVWPYGRNEQIVSLFTLLLAGVFHHPALQPMVTAQIHDLRQALRPDGYGISDTFRCDGDLTAMAFAVLSVSGAACNRSTLRSYVVDQACMTYPQELQQSRSATAHAAHALALLGDDSTPLLSALLEHRDPDGRFTNEKWHGSVWYLTSHTLHACVAAGQIDAAQQSLAAILAHQRTDGGWGIDASNGEETAYGALALLALDQAHALPPAGAMALHCAARWLRANYRPLGEETTRRWTGKELYRPRRIARIEEVAVTFACIQGAWGQQ